jgi:hypothetical protein
LSGHIVSFADVESNSIDSVMDRDIALPVQRLPLGSARDDALLLLDGTQTNGGALQSEIGPHAVSDSAASGENSNKSVDAIDDVFASLAVRW